MGLKRATPKNGPADLITIYKTPYPVLRNYKLWMSDMRLEPYAGGSHINQGPMQPGFITSGYREDPSSPHGFCVALDVAIGDLSEQIKAAQIALRYFNRVGLYPENGFIHVDLINEFLRDYYRKKKAWIRLGGKYITFNSSDSMLEYAKNIRR